MPLAVLVMMAALPTGTNALVFAQRYRVQQAQASVAVVVSTLGFIVSAGLWLAVLGWLG
jgi:malonate transporter and related proteins